MSLEISISKAAADLITKDGEQTFPDECCGFLFGKEEHNQRSITLAQEVHNNKEGDKRRRFQINPLDYMKAERFALENNLQLLGVYHSHPQHPAIPSEHDRVVAMPFFSYVIISVLDGKLDDFRSYRLNDDKQFEEEKVNQEELIS